MARRHKGKRAPTWKRWTKAGVGVLGVVIGTLIATKPFHRGLTLMAQGNFAGGAEAIQFDIGAPGAGRPANEIDFGRVAGVAVGAGIGLGVISLFRYIAKRV